MEWIKVLTLKKNENGGKTLIRAAEINLNNCVKKDGRLNSYANGIIMEALRTVERDEDITITIEQSEKI